MIKIKKYSFFITIDADGQHEPSCIPHFVKKLNSGFDVVVGKRQTQARFSEYLFSFYYRWAALYDFKLLCKNLMKKGLILKSGIICFSQ